MKIMKKINNNFAMALDDNGVELIVTGKGIGFPKTPYELTDLNIIEKKYSVPQNTSVDLLQRYSAEVIEYTHAVVKMGEQILNKTLNMSVFVTLADHIDFALQRFEAEMDIKNPLNWEIKHFFPIHYEIGIQAITYLSKETGRKIPKDEASSIALHFINDEIGRSDFHETTSVMKILTNILNIVQYHFNVEFDEESFMYQRFITHLKFFVIRHLGNEVIEGKVDEMYGLMKERYVAEDQCIHKIEQYLGEMYGWTLSEDEKLYLIIHINRNVS
ncbi:PRD domain-containing protein [Brochothrix campestris]|uniref:Transcription antiterminator LicT n=1 Tax=Brochothrix campestris FSL F6-1037 TaxID=1265861 RepID=W7CEA2_9LIST|nr:PRD domain-containing protein [Brochothrix campestris]EUJ37644.1 transcription antiterminator LicT [Brochothrix campestris FSL F6-1037]